MAKRPESFSDQLRRAIAKSDLTQQDICERTGLCKSVLSRFMHRKGFLSESGMNRLARVLNARLVVDAL